MKKVLLVTLMSMLFGSANAEDLVLTSGRTFKIYGNVDAGLVSVTNMGVKNGSAISLLNSPQKTSRIGFTGSQDLEDGWLAGFKLEHQIMPADGDGGVATSTGVANKFFALNSHIYLLNPSYGRLAIGRQNSLLYDAQRETDARGGLNFGSSLSFWVDNAMFGGTATTKSGLVSMDGSNQISNAVRYETPVWQGLTLGGMWAPGGVAGDDSASSKYAATAVYKGIDNLSLVAGQIWLNDSTGTTTGRTRVLGGNYKFLDNKATMAVGYITFENPSKNGQANSEFTLKDITAKYYITPKFDISGGWYKLDDEVNGANSARQLSLVGNYNIVKNVDIYAGWAQMKNQGGLGLAPLAQGAMSYNSLSSSYSGSVVSQPGQTHDAIMAGIQIRF